MDKIEQLEKALIAADAAGDTAAAQALAAEIRRVRSEGQSPQTEEQVERTLGQNLLRQLGLTGRHVIEGGASLLGLVGDPLNTAINIATGANLGSVSGAGERLATSIGLPEPETPTERVVGAGSQALVGGGGTIGLSRLAASKLAQGGGQLAAEVMAAQPSAQLAGAAGSGLAQQAVAEEGGGTLAQTAAALAGGVAGARAGIFGEGGKRVSPIAGQVKEAQRAGVKVMTSDVFTPKTFAAKWLQRSGEMVPIAGTGGPRKAQQLTRIEAIKDTLRSFGADDLSISHVDDVADDLLKTRSFKHEKLSKLKRSVIDGLKESGDMPVKNSTKGIDNQIASLMALKTKKVDPVISILRDFKNSIQEQNIVRIEELRKIAGEAFEGEKFSDVKKIGEKSLRAIYRPLLNDMGKFIQNVGSKKDLTKWKIANKELSTLAGELKKTTLKSVLNKAEATPEDVKKLLFSAKPSDVKALYKGLSAQGRRSARAAVLQESLEKAGEQISPEKFVNQLKKRANQIGIFFSGEDLKMVNGLKKAIDMTRQASTAAVAPLSGERAVPVLGAAALADVFGGFGGATISLGTIGGMARLYESPIVRNGLIKLSASKVTEAEAGAILKRIAAAAQTIDKEE